MGDEVRIEKRADRVAVVTLNRPEAMNSLDRAMVLGLRAAIGAIEADSEIDVMILTGAGEKSFCAGVDLKERQTMSEADAHRFRTDEMLPMYRELDTRQKPAIAVVNGYALGGGFELALACDLLLATPNARFAFPEVKWGLVPPAGGCRKLPKLIGAVRAKEVLLAGKALSAEEAERLGVINRIVPSETRLAEALSLAGQIVANVQIAVRGTKRCVDRAIDAWACETSDVEEGNRCYASPERKASMARFGAGKAGA